MEKDIAIITLEAMRKRCLNSENVDISPWTNNKEIKQAINNDFAEALEYGIVALKTITQRGGKGSECNSEYSRLHKRKRDTAYKIIPKNRNTIQHYIFLFRRKLQEQGFKSRRAVKDL